ncbi:Cell division cycle-associated protein 2 [Bagarius yarrelli]|uniref:Cell division cycle-associated protein 2 n=1 Tax=Bagarius yarrelli TaxID=175774 RepID=A0A556VWV1_BAGYA|nr:Cell division cycle-associated protein 2 [Bagarius yarrelli]
MESEAGMEEHRTPLGLLTPSQQNGEPAAALDFSKLTSSQFGITPDSFTAFPKHKDKSRVSQLKARRRSTIGVRGSPETNSLIRFRAKQAMKTPPRTPQVCLCLSPHQENFQYPNPLPLSHAFTPPPYN